MTEHPVLVVRIPVAGPRGEIEARVVDRRPAPWRVVLALWLIRVAGRLVRMRIRVTGAWRPDRAG